MSRSSATSAGTITIGGDLAVNRLGLGTNRLRDDAGSHDLLRAALELDVNFIDTADVYGNGISEQAISKIVGDEHPDLIVATKGSMLLGEQGVRGVDGSPEYLRRAVLSSLQRLRLDEIDLYFLHRVDPAQPLSVSLTALKEIRDRGQIRHIGLSNVSLAQVEEARSYVEVAAVENPYSISDRQHDAVVDYCERHQIAFVAYYPLRRSRLAERGAALAPLLQKYDATASQLALAWLLQRSPAILPIPGTLSPQHLSENVAAAAIQLSPEDARALEQLAA